MINFYNPNLQKATWDYFIILPAFMLSCAIINIMYQEAGWTVQDFHISQVLPFMYEGFIVAINGVRQ